MKKVYAKNPAELLDNPKPKNHTIMAKSTTKKAFGKFTDQAKIAASILAGQAVAAQGNSILVPMLLKNQSATIKQVAKAGIPLTLGVLIAMSTKNSLARSASLGFGTQGVLEAIKLVMPNFNPQEGLGDSSHFIYTDEDGVQHRAAITANGQVVSDTPVAQLPAATASDKTSRYAGSNSFATEVDYV